VSSLISDYKKKQIFNTSQKLLEHLHIKTPIYNFSISLGQELALHRIRKIALNSNPIRKNVKGKKIRCFKSIKKKFNSKQKIDIQIGLKTDQYHGI